MTYIFILQKIVAWRDRLQLFCTFAVNLVKFSAPMHTVLFVQYLFLATEQGGNDITLPYCDIIQHILIPARSVARKTLLWAFLWASNSKFAILSELYPCNNYRAIKYTPVSIEFGIEYPPVSHTLLIQGDNLSPRIIYRAFLNTGGSYCTNSTLCSACRFNRVFTSVKEDEMTSRCIANVSDFEDDELPPADMVNLVGELAAALPIPVRARTLAVRLVHQDLNLVVVNYFPLWVDNTRARSLLCTSLWPTNLVRLPNWVIWATWPQPSTISKLNHNHNQVQVGWSAT